MMDLGVLPGDLVGAGLNMNNRGEIVGASVSAPGLATGKQRAFLWRNGVMSDLNTLVQKDAPLYLLTAFAINDSGEIAGFGVVTTGASAGEIHGFLAPPNNGEFFGESFSPAAQDGTGKNWRLPFGRFGARLMRTR